MNRFGFAARNIGDKLGKMLRDPAAFRFYVRTYLLSAFESVEPDCFIVSYPKSGRTWLRVMLQSYAGQSGLETRAYLDGFSMAVGPVVVRFDHGKGTWVPAPVPANRLMIDAKTYGGKKVIFLVRDPRDVLVSSWYHVTYRDNAYRDDLSTFIRDEHLGIAKIIAYLNLWMAQQHVPTDFLLVRYEDLHTEPQSVLSSVLTFLSIDVDEDIINRAVEASAFDRMKKAEQAGKIDEPWMRSGKGSGRVEESMKVRKGKIGSYREELSPEDVAYVDQVIRDTLTQELPYHITHS